MDCVGQKTLSHEEWRSRPRKMSDEELLRFGRAAASRTFIPGMARR
jgi:hypothetical protein